MRKCQDARTRCQPVVSDTRIVPETKTAGDPMIAGPNLNTN